MDLACFARMKCRAVDPAETLDIDPGVVIEFELLFGAVWSVMLELHGVVAGRASCCTHLPSWLMRRALAGEDYEQVAHRRTWNAFSMRWKMTNSIKLCALFAWSVLAKALCYYSNPIS